jgi:hypothetical protein
MSFENEKMYTFPSEKEMPYPDTLLSTTRGAEAAWKKIVESLAGTTRLGRRVQLAIALTIVDWTDLSGYPAVMQRLVEMNLETALKTYAKEA